MTDDAIPNCVPCLPGDERDYLVECIQSGWVSSVGPFVDRFERMFADYHRVPGAVAAASGTAAIHLGLLAVGVKPGDLVICPTMTFIGTVNPIRYCGADPLFIDAESNTLNLDLATLRDRLEHETERTTAGLVHKPTGRRIAAMVVVHLFGNPVDMDAAMAIAGRHGLPVVEDAAESLGARIGDRLVGTIGDVGCFSFNGNKVITTGGGGMVISNDAARLRRCKHLSTQARSDAFEFVHDDVGYNYRMTNLAAALGVAQFQHLEEFIERKRAHAEAYQSALGVDAGWQIVREPSGTRGTYWMILARRRTANGPLVPVLKELAASGIGVRPVWRPLHRLPIFSGCPCWGSEVADELYRTVCCLPSSVGLTPPQIERVTRALRATTGLVGAVAAER
ncbi:MAG: LegC family aminotransferase [Betaproteobacteria bacterium]|nr:LegC family aminotransferase [Betaproteobacteria bacterium]